MKQSVAFRNSPDVVFAGSLAYIAAITLWSLSILLLCLGYPAWTHISVLFFISLMAAVLSYRYVRRCFGCLQIGPQGVEHQPVTGEKTCFPWGRLAYIKVLPGWMWLYDKQGNKLFSYTYGLGKQHALINAIAGHTRMRKTRPMIWPALATVTAVEQPGGGTKKTLNSCAVAVPQKLEKPVAPKVKPVSGRPPIRSTTSRRPRKTRTTGSGRAAEDADLQTQS